MYGATARPSTSSATGRTPRDRPAAAAGRGRAAPTANRRIRRRSRTGPEARPPRARRSRCRPRASACSSPVIPGTPAAVASTEVAVWMDPKTTPMASCATAQDGEGRGEQPARGRAAARVQPPGQLARSRAWRTERRRRRGRPPPRGARRLVPPRPRSAEQGRAEHERRLVGGALVGEGGVDQARLVGLLLPGDRAPADAGQRPDLRQDQPGDRGRDGLDRPRRTGGGQGHQGDQTRRRRPATARAPRGAGRPGRPGAGHRGAPTALATARAPAEAPPAPSLPVAPETSSSVPSWLIASGSRPRKATRT